MPIHEMPIHCAHALSRYEELRIEYDGMFFASPSLASLALSAANADPAQAGRQLPPIAVFGSDAPPVIRQAATAGMKGADFVDMIYSLLSSPINNPARKPQRLLAPIVFREPLPLS